MNSCRQLPRRQITYEPTTFQAYYYAGNKPGIHIFPGDIVHTWAPDSGGTDKNLKRVALGGDANIGPIYVEGALPGDTLVVHLIKIAPNRATAWQGSRIQQFAITPAYSLAAKYDQRFNGEWQVKNPDGYATLTDPTPALKDFRIKMNPMLGCISVAPAGFEAYNGTHLGLLWRQPRLQRRGLGYDDVLSGLSPGCLIRIWRWSCRDGRWRSDSDRA